MYGLSIELNQKKERNMANDWKAAFFKIWTKGCDELFGRDQKTKNMH